MASSSHDAPDDPTGTAERLHSQRVLLRHLEKKHGELYKQLQPHAIVVTTAAPLPRARRRWTDALKNPALSVRRKRAAVAADGWRLRRGFTLGLGGSNGAGERRDTRDGGGIVAAAERGIDLAGAFLEAEQLVDHVRRLQHALALLVHAAQSGR